ncbi:MAG: bifunctional nicotinamidase/pyrazinamidase [Chitinophagaceae bacterium]
MKALLIIDIQNDFLPGGALAVNEGDTIIPTINALQSQYELVIATQDWHPANHKSFATQHPGKEVFETIELNGLQQTLWPEHCVQGSWGAQFPASLSQNPIAAIFHKGMNAEVDSYSGFFDNAKRGNTGLDGYLKSKGVTAVDICGLAADYCVYYTATDALEMGFQSTILLNATKAIDHKNFEQLKGVFEGKGGRLG